MKRTIHYYPLLLLFLLPMPLRGKHQESVSGWNVNLNDTILVDSLVMDSTLLQGRLMATNSSNNEYTVTFPEFEYKTPEATAFRKYGEVDANEYTGNPNISIPLYTLKFHDITIPISLTYDASGIKVDQEASWVGLGWNLLAGGCINYVMSGGKDISNLYTSPAYFQQFASQGSGYYVTFTTNMENDIPLVEDLQNGYGEQDYYSVNVLGRNLLFVFNPVTNQPEVIGRNEEPFKVEELNGCTYQSINDARWRIIDANGQQYYFEKGESTISNVISGMYTSTWNLTKIVSPKGFTVNFTYSDINQVESHANYSEVYDFILSKEPYRWLVNNKIASCDELFGYHNAYNPPYHYIMTKYLTRIDTDNERVTFSLSDREDYSGAKRIDTIKITSRLTGKEIKKLQFKYSYLSSSTVGGNHLSPSDDPMENFPELRTRLFLNSISEIFGIDTLSTAFEYDPTPLPMKTSFAKDFWGYYNGRENNSHSIGQTVRTLLPSYFPLSGIYNLQSEEALPRFTGAYRYCDPTFIQAGTLKRITYPTKGYTSFTYEPHLFISEDIAYPSSADMHDIGRNYTIYAGDYTSTPYSSPPSHYQFVIDATFHGTLKINYEGTLSNLYNGNANVTIYPMNGGSPIRFDLSDAPSEEIAYGNSYSETRYLSLEAGSYMLTASCPHSPYDDMSFRVYTTIDIKKEISPSIYPVSTGGGLRVKMIEDHDYDGTLLRKTEYKYELENGISSGKLLRPMQWAERKTIIFIGPDYPGDNAGASKNEILRLHNTPVGIPSFTSSVSRGVVGYSRVVKKQYESSETVGRECTSFYLNRIPIKELGKFYFFERFDNGKLEKQYVTDKDSTIIRKVENSYTPISYMLPIYNAIYENRYIDFRGAGILSMDFPHYKFWTYPFRTSWSFLSRSTKTEYDGTDSLIVTHDYTYNLGNHQVASDSYNSSIDSLWYVGRYFYPSDYTTSIMQSMCDSVNFILNPIIKETLSVMKGETERVIRKHENQYASIQRDTSLEDGVNFCNNKSSFAPSGGSLEQRLSYTYDHFGNVTSVTKDGNEYVAYLYSYNHTYPVAEIKGASYSQIVSWLGTSRINTLSSSTTGIAELLSEVRNILAAKDILVTTYTFEPSVGMTSMTLPNGTTTYYEYDAAGRLSVVRNHDGSLVERNTYHYKQ